MSQTTDAVIPDLGLSVKKTTHRYVLQRPERCPPQERQAIQEANIHQEKELTFTKHPQKRRNQLKINYDEKEHGTNNAHKVCLP